MANEAYIYRIRTDLGSGAMQITDLKPNTSRRTFSYETYGQSGYVPVRNSPDNVTAAANPTAVDYSGIEAYILDNTNVQSTGFQIAAADAHAIGAAIVALADSGAELTISALNDTFLATLGAGEVGTMPFPFTAESVADADGAGNPGVLSGGTTSTGTHADFMKALCGGSYTLPTGSTVDPTAATSQEGSFNDNGWRQLYQSGAMSLSAGQGDIATYSSATFSYASATGAAIVAYKADGSVL